MTTHQNLVLEEFLHEHLRDDGVGWPRLWRNGASTTDKAKILVRGNLVLDLPIRTKITLAEFTASLTQGQEKFRCEWECGEPVVGGFAGQIAPLAADLGFSVHLNCAVAVPAPKPIFAFLECGRYDTRHAVVFPGTTPASVELLFSDGHILLSRRGLDNSLDVPLPPRLTDAFDIVLVNPGPRQGRLVLLDRLTTDFRVGQCRAKLGIVARGDWTVDDLSRVREANCWLYFNRAEALEAASRVLGNGAITSAEVAARVLKSHLGTETRLVITLDRDGAFLLNGEPEPHRIPTTPATNGKATGAGDTLTLFATAASAAGFCDEEALKVGVDAASKRVAGQALPRIG